MTTNLRRPLRLLLSGLAVSALMAGQSALATTLDAGPHGAPAPICAPNPGGEVNTLCARPRIPCGDGVRRAGNPYTYDRQRCDINDRGPGG